MVPLLPPNQLVPQLQNVQSQRRWPHLSIDDNFFSPTELEKRLHYKRARRTIFILDNISELTCQLFRVASLDLVFNAFSLLHGKQMSKFGPLPHVAGSLPRCPTSFIKKAICVEFPLVLSLSLSLSPLLIMNFSLGQKFHLQLINSKGFLSCSLSRATKQHAFASRQTMGNGRKASPPSIINETMLNMLFALYPINRM